MANRQAIVLIGMPGSGKTTVGSALARLLQWGLVDTDDVLHATLGCDFAEYIRAKGIDAARERERGVVGDLPDLLIRDSVVAVGGGTVLHPDNRTVLSGLGPVVWLRATPDTLLTNVAGDDRDRPLLAEGESALMRLLEERTPVYESLANVTVDVDGLDPNQVALEVVKALA
ncbi:MAG: shikimate kinase [Actinomycetota bacterium]|jgi:shikimate kinase